MEPEVDEEAEVPEHGKEGKRTNLRFSFSLNFKQTKSVSVCCVE
jgi:hypothetical protein